MLRSPLFLERPSSFHGRDAFLSQEGVFISLESQLGVGRGQLLSARSPGLSPEVASGWGDSCLFSHLST